jgi:YD repeat-containing protein
MKRIVLLLVSFFTGVIIYGQTTVSFNYDGSGNRTSRNTIGLKSTASTQDEKTSSESFSEQLGNQRILIYPNPVESALTVSIEGKDANSSVVITVYDQGGKLILNNDNATELNVLNLSHLPPGNYFMNILIGNDLSQWKIVKE